MESVSSNAVVRGVIAAFVIMALAGAAGWLYLQRAGAFTSATSSERVVFALASTGEDDAVIAGIVVVVGDGGAVEVRDPMERVSIPGTSYDRLRDAYPFGGAVAVAAALGEPDRAAWVDVPETAWVAALEAQGGSADTSGLAGVRVTLPRDLDVFDGERLASFHEGDNIVRPVDVPLLLRGAAYLPAKDRVAIATTVGEAAVRALAARPGEEMATNLKPEALSIVLSTLRAR